MHWIGWDVPLRLLPFAAVALLWAYVVGDGLETLKITWRVSALDVALMLGVGVLVFAACTLYRARFWPITSLSSARAHLVEDGYFLFFNAPAEELFFRGMLQTWAMSVPFVPPIVGFAAVALSFGFYHILVRFPLPFLILSSAGGVLFGILFLVSDSILTPIVVHFIADLALFNLGPQILVRFGKIPYRTHRARVG
jgi:membrane protease YdiL (CAAX protease family)